MVADVFSSCLCHPLSTSICFCLHSSLFCCFCPDQVPLSPGCPGVWSGVPVWRAGGQEARAMTNPLPWVSSLTQARYCTRMSRQQATGSSGCRWRLTCGSATPCLSLCAISRRSSPFMCPSLLPTPSGEMCWASNVSLCDLTQVN